MVTPESVKAGIESGLACEHLEVIGDGEHFQALIVSAAFAVLSFLTLQLLRSGYKLRH